MMKKSRKLWQIALAVMIVFGLLSISGLTYAQSSPNFDLGCWGVMTSGGGRIQYGGAYLLNAAIGQTAAGEANSAQFKLRAGYLQDWQTLSMPRTQVVAEPATLNAGGKIFLPIVNNFRQIVRPCTYK